MMNQSHSEAALENIHVDAVAEHLPYPLREYQWEGVRFLRNSQSALLADEMGLGKSVQTAVALDIGRHDYKRVLLVAPSSLCLNWQREIQTWAPKLVVRRVTGNAQERAAIYRLPIQVLIASYDQIRIDCQRIYSTVRFDLMILDEAQRIKNINSETSLACRIIPRDRAWALSGTPLENHPDDLIAIFRFLKPRLLHSGMSRSEIHGAMAGYFLRRSKAEVLDDLPPIISRDIDLEFGILQRRAYDRVWHSRSESLSSMPGGPTSNNMLALLTRLKQLCNVDMESGSSVKLDVVRTMLETIAGNGEKVLIFSQYVATLDWLSRHLDIPHAIFHGGLSADAREQLLHRFKNGSGPQALLISLHAGGVGLNLEEASTVIMFDRWWNPAVENQAIQRAHRFGRQLPLQVIRFVVANSVEERIIKILGEKQMLFDEYVEQAPGPAADAFKTSGLRRILQLS